MKKIKIERLFLMGIIISALFGTSVFPAGIPKLDYREVFENHKMIRLIIDAESGDILDVNQEALNYYGYTREKILEMNISQINTMSSEEVREEYHAAYLEERNHFYFRHKLAGGEIRDVEVHSYPIVCEGRPLLYSIIIDRTKMVEAEKRDANRIIINYVFAGVLGMGVGGLLLLRKIKEKYRKLSNYDQLTSVYSRHYLIRWQQRKVKQMQRRLEVITVVLLDVDGFKKINDEHGHKVGDDVLVEVAQVLKTSLRDEDLIVRYGGDEFVLLMERIDESKANTIMERIQDKLLKEENLAFPVMISYGIVESSNTDHIFEAIDRADARMYQMKNKRKTR